MCFLGRTPHADIVNEHNMQFSIDTMRYAS